eukprot:174449-Rhodomonas_salina.1
MTSLRALEGSIPWNAVLPTRISVAIPQPVDLLPYLRRRCGPGALTSKVILAVSWVHWYGHRHAFLCLRLRGGGHVRVDAISRDLPDLLLAFVEREPSELLELRAEQDERPHDERRHVAHQLCEQLLRTAICERCSLEGRRVDLQQDRASMLRVVHRTGKLHLLPLDGEDHAASQLVIDAVQRASDHLCDGTFRNVAEVDRQDLISHLKCNATADRFSEVVAAVKRLMPVQRVAATTSHKIESFDSSSAMQKEVRG